MHAPLAQRTEPYTSPAALSTCKHSALMYCTSALSALNHTPPAVLHYTLRTPLTLPQRTELFVSLTAVSSSAPYVYGSLCLSFPWLPSLLYPIPTWVWSSLGGAAEGRRDPLIDLSKWGIWCFGPYMYTLITRARAG